MNLLKLIQEHRLNQLLKELDDTDSLTMSEINTADNLEPIMERTQDNIQEYFTGGIK